MIRHEWYKLWHNPRLVAVFLLLVVANCGYFAYRANHASPAASEYRSLQADLSGYGDAEAEAIVREDVEAIRSIIYMDATDEAPRRSYPVYTNNLWTELSLYDAFTQEYENIRTYPEYIKKVVNAPATYRVLQSLFSSNERELRNVEKTAKDFEALTSLSLRRTQTKGISEALSLPSLIFLEILFAVLLMSVLLSREKEQDFLTLYATMPNGRGRLIVSKVVAATMGIVVGNLILQGTTVVTGCILYGWPGPGDWTQPIQSVIGYRQTALSVNILMFLTLVYLGSLLVSLWFALFTAFLTVVFASTRAVYLVMFAIVGIEGLLYLRIEDISYLAAYKRVNLVAFADVPGRLGKYRNFYVFGQPVNDWLVGLVVLLVTGALLFGALIWCAVRGKGLGAKKRSARLAIPGTALGGRRFGLHGNLFLHEAYKYLRLEKIGVIFILLVLWILFFTTPYPKEYSMEELHYESLLRQLQDVSKEEYPALAVHFRAELEEARRHTDPSLLSDREHAVEKIEEYVWYLMKKEGATAVNEQGYEQLYNNRRQNILMGAGALFLVILCATSLYYIEYRTGMHEMIRISCAGRYRVHVWKFLLLFLSAVVICATVYGRHAYRVTQSYGTVGIASAASSLRDLADSPEKLVLREYLILVYIKRFLGLVIGSAVAVAVIRKVRSFIFAVVGSVLVMVLPLLLALFETDLLDRFLLNRFFIR